MFDKTQSNTSRWARRWAWGNRPANRLDNPVKRYLGNSAIGHGLRQRQPRMGLGHLTMRPAT